MPRAPWGQHRPAHLLCSTAGHWERVCLQGPSPCAREITRGKVLAGHVPNPGSIPGVIYGPGGLLRVTPEHRVLSTVGCDPVNPLSPTPEPRGGEREEGKWWSRARPFSLLPSLYQASLCWLRCPPPGG